MADPIHQFEIHKLFPIANIGGHEIAFTNSSLYMVIAVGIIAPLLVGATSARSVVPGRLQSIAELSYEFVATTIRSTAGSDGMRFFPLVFSLFMFILVANIVGLIPYTFTVTSHIIITVSLALLGVPHGADLRPLRRTGCTSSSCSCRAAFRSSSCRWSLFIEVLSFFLRPISHSVRLFANMLAGHITLKVFAELHPACWAAPSALVGWAGGALPLGMVVALTALELLVAFLQAYVFAILTCIYLNDAIHPGH